MNKRLIFCCTTGRSGTKLLAELLSLVPNVHSEHEARPSFENFWWQTKNVDYTQAEKIYKRFWENKLRVIAKTGKPIYSETSHMTFKGFIEYLPDDVDYSIIFLQRDPRSVAKSLYNLGDIPGRTRTGVRNCFGPKDNNNIINISDRWSKFTDYQLCYWYVKEMNARADMYWEAYKDNSKVVTTKIFLSRLLDLSMFIHMLEWLGLSINIDITEYTRIISTRWNAKHSRKMVRTYPERFCAEEQAVDKLWPGVK